MKRNQIGILCFLAFLLSYGCEEIPPEIPPIQAPSGNKNVLIEEFSGVQCSNCPVGDAKINDLRSLYEGRVFSITMHAYATQVLSAPMSDSRYDYRTDAAEAIIDYLGEVSGIPAAAVNRVQFDGQSGLLSPPNQWSSHVEKELEKEAKASLFLTTDYDSDSRLLEIEVRIEAQSNLEGDIRIHLGIIEDHLVDAQIDGTMKIENYEHNHILRDYVTGNLGDNVRSRLSQGEVWTRDYRYTVPEEDGWWVAEHLHLVGFVSNITEESREVLQVTEVQFYDPE